MKNKKLVATVASLCLVVVAVVAAVVGVFAAVTQNVQNTFQVKYVARNVHAIVSLDSMGPTYTSGTRDYAKDGGNKTWEKVTDHDATTFTPGQGTTTDTLQAKNYNFGWDSDSTSTVFYGTAVYRFKFENESAVPNDTLQIAWSFNLSAVPADLEVTFYKGAATLDHDVDDFMDTYSAAGTRTKASLPTGTQIVTPAASNASATLDTIANGADIYLYMVVSVRNMVRTEANNDTYTNLGQALNFVLTNPTTEVQA